MRTGIILVAVIVAGLITAIYFKSSTKHADPDVEIHNFAIVEITGDSIIFNSDSFDKKLIFNYYSSACVLCLAEVNEILSYSRKENIEVLFITSDSEDDFLKFASQLRANLLKENDKVRFARIKTEDAGKFLGETTVPQTVVFEEGLKVKRIKRGMVSASFLHKAFE